MKRASLVSAVILAVLSWMPQLDAGAASRRATPSVIIIPSAPLTVNSTADASDADAGDGVCADAFGRCTLRAAIQEANAKPEHDTIEFDVGAGGPVGLAPVTGLPAIVNPVTIDGTTQPGFAGTPIVQLVGLNTIDANGFVIDSSSLIQGLVINRFDLAGIRLEGGTSIIRGNYIGTDRTGTAPLGNGIGVVTVTGVDSGSDFNLIGGTNPGQGNLVSGNGTGISLASNSNVLQGNLVGLDNTGSSALGNTFDGVVVHGSSNVVGGNSSVSERNVISGNGRFGIRLFQAFDSTIQGNRVGADVTGTTPVGNGSAGIDINGLSSAGNVVGGASLASNTIAFNGGDGVTVESGDGNALRGNSIFSNGQLGIDLLPNGVTPNDQIDGDNGANNLQNFPVFVFGPPTSTATQITIPAGLNSDISTTYDIDYFSSDTCDPSGNGEGKSFIGTAQAFTDLHGNAAFTRVFNVRIPAGRFITATATSPSGDTSEFSACRQIPFSHTFVVNTTSDQPDLSPGDGACKTFSFNCSLRAAIQQANSSPGEDLVKFGIGSGAQTITPGSSLPAITDLTQIDATTQPGFGGTPLITLVGSVAGVGTDGLRIAGGNSLVRGMAINRFSGDGIDISGGGANTIVGNRIGTDAVGTTDLGNGASGVSMTSSFNTIGGLSSADRNVISGNQGPGILIASPGTGNRVAGNFIGLRADGQFPLGNSGDGVRIQTAGNTVGSPSPLARNIISGNRSDGIEVVGTTEVNQILGNRIGTDVTGAFDRGNLGHGVFLHGAPGTIGGAALGAGNVISGNNSDQVTVALSGASGSKVLGNIIGPNAAGTASLTCGFCFTDGVVVAGAGDVVIGGTTPLARNVISGNSDGVVLNSALGGNQLLGNFIGTNLTGTSGFANGDRGVEVRTTPGATIGSQGLGGNVISDNIGAGIMVAAPGARIEGNKIGTNVFGTADLGNTEGDGIDITGADGAIIQFNTIRFNSGFTRGNGIDVEAGSHNQFFENSMSDNGGLGIDLGANGVTPNDPGDADTGPNGLQNFPVISSAVSGHAGTAITTTLDSQPNSQYQVDYYVGSCDPSGFGEGKTHFLSIRMDTDASGHAEGTLLTKTGAPIAPVGSALTATATPLDPSSPSGTSEFSPCRTVQSGPDVIISKANAPDPVRAGDEVEYTIPVTNTGPGSAADVTVTDQLPFGLIFAAATSTQGTCTFTAPTVTCAIGSLGEGASATVTINAAPTLTGVLSNLAIVATSTAESNPRNDQASSVTDVVGQNCTIVGTQGPDTLTGTSGPDVICGLRGPDQMSGLGGADTLVGGRGGDTVLGGGAPDQIFGGSDGDNLQGQGGNDTIHGGPGLDQIFGGPGFDTLLGEQNNDTLNSVDGVSGNDSNDGGPGTDTCVTDQGDTTTSCETVDDTSGTFELTPTNATAQVGDHVVYTLTWTVPQPRVWRDLRSIDFRLGGQRANRFWVRWDEATNTFRLVNPQGKVHGPGGQPGASGKLTGALATLNLHDSSVVGSGPTGPSVTLTLDLILKHAAGGHTFRIEVAGADDIGHRDAFVQAGTLVVP